MPKYRVLITRDITESTVVEVEVDTLNLAEDTALELLFNSTDTVWQIDDGSCNSGDGPYVTGVDLVDGEGV